MAAHPLYSFKLLRRNIFEMFTQISDLDGHCGAGIESWLGTQELWALDTSLHWLLAWAWVWPLPKSWLFFTNSRTLISASHHYILWADLKQVHTMNVHNCIVHNSPKMETTQMSINWQMDIQNIVCPHKGILFSQNEEWNSGTCNMGEVWRHCANGKKPDTSDHTSHDSIYMKCEK